MSIKNSYMRAILYGFISATLIFLLGLFIGYVKLKYEGFYNSYFYIIIVVMVLINYLLITFFNILFLNKIDIPLKKWSYYLTNTIIYLIILLFVLKSGLAFVAYSNGLGFDLVDILPLPGLLDLIYLMIFPYLYLKYDKALKKLNWF